MNITPFARTQVVVTNIPLPRGLVTDTNGARLTARSAYLGADVPVQIMPPAYWSTRVAGVRKYPDGSWRMARVAFPVSIDGATSSAHGYPLFEERVITLEEGGVDLPAFSVDPALELADIQFRWNSRMWDPEAQTSQPPQRSVTFSATQGRITDWRSPYTVTTPAAVEEWDTATIDITRGWVHAFRVSGRIMPEEFGGPPEEPTTYATVQYEVPNASIEGAGRVLQAWVEVGHSLVTSDLDARAPGNKGRGKWLGRPSFEVRSASGARDWLGVIDQQGKLGTGVTRSGGSVRIHHLTPGDRVNGGEDQFPIYYSRVVRCALFPDPAGASSLETSTAQACLYNSGQQARIDAMSSDWRARQENFGPYGSALTADDVGFASEGELRTQLRRTDEAQIARYEASGSYPMFPQLTNRIATSESGNHNNFCAFGLQYYVAANLPDFRMPWLSMTLGAHRNQTWRNLDCEPTNWNLDYRRAATPSSYYSSTIMYDGFIIGKGSGNPASWQEKGGKNEDVPVEYWPCSIPRGTRWNSGDPRNGYNKIDNQHIDFGHQVAFAMLTGDRWMVGRRMLDMTQILLNHKQVNPDPRTFGVGNNSSIGLLNNRAEGRVLRCRAQVASFTGDSAVYGEIAKRIQRHDEWRVLGAFPGEVTWPGAPTHYEREIPALGFDTGYFVNDRWVCGTNTQVVVGGSIGDNEGYSPWQQGIAAEGMFVASKILVDDDVSASIGYAGLENARKLCRGVTRGGWREHGDGQISPYYAVDYRWDNSNYGVEVPLSAQTSPQRLCSSAGGSSTREVYGPPNPPRNSGHYRLGDSDFIPYTLGPSMILAHYYPNDDYAPYAFDLLRDRVQFRSRQARSQEVGDYQGNHAHLLCVVPDPFGAWDSGGTPRTYDETAAADLDTDAAGTETSEVAETAAADLELDSTGTETSAALYLETAAADLELDSTGTDGLGVATAPLLIDETGVADLEMFTELEEPSLVFEESAVVDLDVSGPLYEAIDRNDVTPDDLVTVADDGSLTIDEAIGRDRIRARAVRLYRDSRGDPQRITRPGPWRGSVPVQRTFHPDARIDDA